MSTYPTIKNGLAKFKLKLKVVDSSICQPARGNQCDGDWTRDKSETDVSSRRELDNDGFKAFAQSKKNSTVT